MQLLVLRSSAVALLAALSISSVPLRATSTVQVPAGIDHAPWNVLLKTYVNERGLVDYASWMKSEDDLRALDRYLAEFNKTDGPSAEGDAEIAALINVYNAITIRWMLDNYPTPSIRETKDSWKGARWKVGGRTVSLDEIEHKNLRPLYSWKVHATIVCAARSCPPLQRDAYTDANLEALTAQAYRAWLGRSDLNHYDATKNTVYVSPIFKWFKDDFKGDGALAKLLARFGPDEFRAFVDAGNFKVEYLDYHWGINDRGELGKDYKAGVSAIFKSIF